MRGRRHARRADRRLSAARIFSAGHARHPLRHARRFGRRRRPRQKSPSRLLAGLARDVVRPDDRVGRSRAMLARGKLRSVLGDRRRHGPHRRDPRARTADAPRRERLCRRRDDSRRATSMRRSKLSSAPIGLRLFGRVDRLRQHASPRWAARCSTSATSRRSTNCREISRRIRSPRCRSSARSCRSTCRCVNSLTVRAFNAINYSAVIASKSAHTIFDWQSFFYPLDSIRNWHRIYGKRGFVQYQCVWPPDESRAGLVEMLEATTRSRRASFLAVLKKFGRTGRPAVLPDGRLHARASTSR